MHLKKLIDAIFGPKNHQSYYYLKYQYTVWPGTSFNYPKYTLSNQKNAREQYFTYFSDFDGYSDKNMAKIRVKLGKTQTLFMHPK